MVFPEQLSENLDGIYCEQNEINERKIRCSPLFCQVYTTFVISLIQIPAYFSIILLEPYTIPFVLTYTDDDKTKITMLSSLHPAIGWLIQQVIDVAQRGEAGTATFTICAYIIGGWLVETSGRKNTMLIVAFLRSCAWLIMTLSDANNLYYVLGGFLNELCLDVVQVPAYIYLAEISDPKYRGLLFAAMALMTSLGESSQLLLKTYLPSHRILPIVVILAVAGFISLTVCPESPVYLSNKGDLEKTKSTFYWFRGRGEEAEKELEEILSVQPTSGTKNRNFLWQYWLQFSKKQFLKPLFVCAILTLVHEFTGSTQISTIVYLSDSLGFAQREMLLAFFQILCCLLNLLLFHVLSRRLLMFVSYLGLAIAWIVQYILSLSGITSELVTPPIAVTCFIFAFIGIDTIPSILCTEIFPNPRRGYGTGASFALEIAVQSVLPLSETYFRIIIFTEERSVSLLIFAVACCLGAILVLVFLPETHKKSLCEIKKSYLSENSRYIQIGYWNSKRILNT